MEDVRVAGISTNESVFNTLPKTLLLTPIENIVAPDQYMASVLPPR